MEESGGFTLVCSLVLILIDELSGTHIMKALVVILGLIVPSSLALAQGKSASSGLLRAQPSATKLTGNAWVDLIGQTELKYVLVSPAQVQGAGAPGYKSPWLAAGLSMAVPGAGEFYAESFWKSAGFFALDVAAWVLAYSYDRRGDRQTDSFQDFANQHWSVAKYAQYALDNLAPPGAAYDGLFVSGTEGRPPWERVNWQVLNRMERDISATQKGQYYSHTLPPYNDQQYYELIGKYPQFNQGWDDALPIFVYGDPVTAQFLYYSKERGKANDYYNNASTFVVVAVVNHVLSAVDAAWSAGTYNSVHARVGMQTVPARDRLARVPVVTLSYSF
jgi:hypothetical protein